MRRRMRDFEGGSKEMILFMYTKGMLTECI
jgi:hypothetical protein